MQRPRPTLAIMGLWPRPTVTDERWRSAANWDDPEGETPCITTVAWFANDERSGAPGFGGCRLHQPGAWRGITIAKHASVLKSIYGQLAWLEKEVVKLESMHLASEDDNLLRPIKEKLSEFHDTDQDEMQHLG
ncbi:hypothetical protein NDU88_009579 [Pleurodeles waltl]|uniref:Uncharacterized protein n=1 Tax=Pleurodeles waltl TaxID=8319 RepID=A0AAV7RYT1_PLEWA|nr:hypothetical protein NDU88_009579 [Pleurodeles waltl]